MEMVVAEKSQFSGPGVWLAENELGVWLAENELLLKNTTANGFRRSKVICSLYMISQGKWVKS